MLIRPHILLIVLILALVPAMYALATDFVSQDAKQADDKINKDKCLACHGPYEKLTEKTVQFKTPGGETVAPHRYVPHEEKKDIPECTECHTPHTIPLADKSTVVKPKEVKWCYTSCHHQNNFQPCSGCH